MGSRHKLEGERAGQRPERQSAGEYSIRDDHRVDRVGPTRAKTPSSDGEDIPSHNVARRPVRTSDAIARVKLRSGEEEHVSTDEGRETSESSSRMAAAASNRPQLRTRQMEPGWEREALDDRAPAAPLKQALPKMNLPPSVPNFAPPTAKSKAPPPTDPEAPWGRPTAKSGGLPTDDAYEDDDTTASAMPAPAAALESSITDKPRTSPSGRKLAATVELEPGWADEVDGQVEIQGLAEEGADLSNRCVTVPAPAPESGATAASQGFVAPRPPPTISTAGLAAASTEYEEPEGLPDPFDVEIDDEDNDAEEQSTTRAYRPQQFAGSLLDDSALTLDPVGDDEGLVQAGDSGSSSAVDSLEERVTAPRPHSPPEEPGGKGDVELELEESTGRLPRPEPANESVPQDGGERAAMLPEPSSLTSGRVAEETAVNEGEQPRVSVAPGEDAAATAAQGDAVPSVPERHPELTLRDNPPFMTDPPDDLDPRDTPPIGSLPPPGSPLGAPKKTPKPEEKPSEDSSRQPQGRERLAGLEAAVASGDWATVHEEADRLAKGADASPTMMLVDAIACRELNQGAQDDADHHRRAIGAMERLLELQPQSPVARLLAERLLQRPPTAAPRTARGVAMLFMGLVIGAGASWLATQLLF